MKFLETLAAKYESLNLEKPEWLNEQVPGVIPTIASTAASTLASAANPAGAAGVTMGGGVVNALMKAMDVLKDDPEVQKVKTTVQQKVADAKKQITDTGSKVVDTLTKAIDDVGKSTQVLTTKTAAPSPTTPTVK